MSVLIALAALALLRHGDDDFALAYADVSTGELTVLPIPASAVGDELARIDPAELLFTAATRDALRDLKVLLPPARALLDFLSSEGAKFLPTLPRQPQS